MRTYEAALEGVSGQAIIDAAARFTKGEVAGQSRTFCPSLAEFVPEAKTRQELLNLASRPRIPAPTFHRGPLAPFQVAQQKAFAENSHLPVLFEDINFDQWKRMSKDQQVPPGSKWVAALGIVYGPENRQSQAA
jgi:hypothetical protein